MSEGFLLRVVTGYVFLNSADTFEQFLWSQIVVLVLVTPKQEVEQNGDWFCGVKFFCSSFKVQ